MTPDIEPLSPVNPHDRLPCSNCGHASASHGYGAACIAADCICKAFRAPPDWREMLSAMKYRSPIQSTLVCDPECRDCREGSVVKKTANGYGGYGTCPRCAAYSRGRR